MCRIISGLMSCLVSQPGVCLVFVGAIKTKKYFPIFHTTQSSARPPRKLNLDAQCGSNSFQIRGFIRNIIALTTN